METWEMRQHRLKSEGRWMNIKSTIVDVLGSAILFGMVFRFCWLCCAASGYHWE